MSTEVDLNPFEVDLDKIDAQLAEMGVKADLEEGAASVSTVTDEGKNPGEVAPKRSEESKPSADPAKPDETKDEKADQVVLARDGKSAIPFSVLESARSQARANAELLSKERGAREALERELAELRAQAAGQKPVATGDAPAGVTDERLAELETEAPELANIFKGLISEIKTMGAKLEQVQAKAATIDNLAISEQARQEQTIQQVIDSDPRLVVLQSEPEKFNKLVDLDDTIRQNPEFAGLSLADRIAKSFEMYQVLYGKVEAPVSVKQEVGTKPSAASATAKLAATPARPAVPSTLSDLPAGGLPDNSLQDTIAAMSPQALTAKLMEMDTNKQAEFLAQMTS